MTKIHGRVKHIANKDGETNIYLMPGQDGKVQFIQEAMQQIPPFSFGYSFTWGVVCALSSVYVMVRIIEFILQYVK